VLTRADGSEERFPHLVTDRAKPGVIAVNQRAVRFVNESSSYHHFASAMQRAAENAPCFLLCDAQAMKRYGLGLARPAPVNNDALIAAGYLHKADTLAALAQQLGLDAHALSETVARYNRDAAQGVDREFAKGGNSYNRAMGDPGHHPDACNAPCSARRSMPSNSIPAIWGLREVWSPPPMPRSSTLKATPLRGCTRWETTWIR
jgi:succinate dehydrogenase/fumarate reductase flavoprotein subunit